MRTAVLDGGVKSEMNCTEMIIPFTKEEIDQIDFSGLYVDGHYHKESLRKAKMSMCQKNDA